MKNLFFILWIMLLFYGCNKESIGGKKLPEFITEDIYGKKISSQDLIEKVVVVDVWATWCPPCRMVIPDLEEIYRENKDKGLIVIGLCVDHDKTTQQIKEFAKKFNITYPIIFDRDQKITSKFGYIRGLPTVFIIDRTGNIRHKKSGAAYDYKNFLMKYIQPLL